MSRFTSTRPSNSERFSRRRFLRASVEVGAGAFALLPALAARAQTAAQITTTDLGGLKLFQGAGSNVLALHGDDGALMVDGDSRQTPTLCCARCTPRPATIASGC